MPSAKRRFADLQCPYWTMRRPPLSVRRMSCAAPTWGVAMRRCPMPIPVPPTTVFWPRWSEPMACPVAALLLLVPTPSNGGPPMGLGIRVLALFRLWSTMCKPLIWLARPTKSAVQMLANAQPKSNTRHLWQTTIVRCHLVNPNGWPVVRLQQPTEAAACHPSIKV